MWVLHGKQAKELRVFAGFMNCKLRGRWLAMRLLSWNIHKGIGGRDRRYSLQRIIDCIDHERPDLVCLQEVDRLVSRSNFDDQPRLLGQTLNLHSIFQANVPVANGTYGNLILLVPFYLP